MALALAAFTALALFGAFRGAAPAGAETALVDAPGRGFLPDNRAWEMVSPPDKNGGDVMASMYHTRAAADGGAATFASLAFFGDSRGGGITSEYMSVRGDDGWSTHAISPASPVLSVPQTAQGFDPHYEAEFTPDLDSGYFRSSTGLTDEDPNSADASNVYLASGLRTPGAPDLQLQTPSAVPLPSSSFATDRPRVIDATPDLSTVVIGSQRNLTGTTGGWKAYAASGGSLRLIGQIPTLPDTTCGDTGPSCVVAANSDAGAGQTSFHYAPDVVSDDGTKVVFSAPTTSDGRLVTGGSAPNRSRLFVRDSRGTASEADDVTTQVNASERTTADTRRAPVYLTSSTSGDRVLFLSQEALTDSAPVGTPHLYLYDSGKSNDEVQRLTVDAAEGTFTLSFGGDTTDPIDWDAGAAEIESSLQALASISGAGGDVSVSSGPAGDSDFLITFGGDLGGTDQPAIVSDATGLNGGTATVAGWSRGGGHLTLLDQDFSAPFSGDRATGVLGASTDLSTVYFASTERLLPGVPDDLIAGGNPAHIYMWKDSGELSYTGMSVSQPDVEEGAGYSQYGSQIDLRFRQSATTDDGSVLVFAATHGEGLTGFDHNDTDDCHGNLPDHDNAHNTSGCFEYYRYDSGTGDVTCMTCNPSGVPPTLATEPYLVANEQAVGASQRSTHVPNFLSSDGNRFFFNSGGPLVPEDTNGETDAYEYDATTGQIRLLSSGTGNYDSYFVDSSADGTDVLIVTREKLSAWDVDNALDLYDARVDGGVPEPEPGAPECTNAEDCHDPATPPPDDDDPASTEPTDGNPSPTADCSAQANRVSALKRKVGDLRRRARSAHGKRARKLRHRAQRKQRKLDRARTDLRTCRAGGDS